MAKTQTPKSKKVKSSKKELAPVKKAKAKATAKSLTQQLTEKIAQKLIKRKVKKSKIVDIQHGTLASTGPNLQNIPKPKKVYTSIPEDLKISVNLKGHPNIPGAIDFSKFRCRDLQRACVIRGLPPEELVKGDIIRLQSWLMVNRDTKVDVSLLDAFDKWREKLLEEKWGKGEPFVRLGYIGKIDEEGEPIHVFQPKPKKPKKHIEKDEKMGGLWKGTKKHLTVQCKKDGLSLEKTMKKVKAQFADAKESSIKIWFKRAT